MTMKIRLSKLAVSALTLNVSTAFLTGNTRGLGNGAVRYENVQQPLFAGTMEEVSTSQIAPVASDDSALNAYEEWREKFGKGDFDQARFENFKKNFERLTQANLDAKEKAISEGKNPPRLMTLNEYGDFSFEEYKSIAQQSGAINGVAINGVVGYHKDDYSEMEKALEFVEECLNMDEENLDAADEERVLKLRSMYEKCPEAYGDWCARFNKESDNDRFANFAKNYIAMLVFLERTGKTLELNQYADCTREEYLAIIGGSAPAEGSDGDVNPATSKRKTYFIRDSSKPAQSRRKTELIPESNEAPPGRATMVIDKSSPEETDADEAESSTDSVKGTQVIRRAGVPQPVAGTQVIKHAAGVGPGTQVIQSSGTNAPVGGTRVIRSATQGTQVIKSASSPTPVRGTRVLKKKPLGTRAVVQPEQDKEPVNGDTNGGTTTGGTMVIKRQIPGPEGSDESSGLSLFGGSKVNGGSERTVRGTIVLQRKSNPGSGRRQTLLVSKSELDGAVPSVFSFFGGADSRNANTRGTIVIKKNKNDYHKTKSKEKQAQLDKIKQAVEAKRVVAKKRRDALLGISEKGPEKSEPAPAGPTGSPGDIPEVKDWKQNADGSITGLIYRSMSFKDGTKITTSPVPKGAKAGYLVKTNTGSRYILK